MLSPLESEALGLSLRVACWSVVASLPFGLAVAWLLARREFPGKSLLNGLVHLPLVVPPVGIRMEPGWSSALRRLGCFG